MTNEKSQKSAHRVPPYRRPIIIAAFLAVIIVTAIGTILFLKNSNDARQISLSDPGDTNNENTGNTISTENHSKPSDDELKKVVQYEGEDPNTAETLSGSIAYKGIDANTLYITATIDQYLSTEGTCTLKLTSDNNDIYEETVAAVADITTSVCEPFNIPIAKLKTGHWSIEINVKADDKTGTIKDSDGVEI